jgi:hypothetical protein
MPVEFVSLGSGAPIITGFEPDSAAWLDTIKISGKNFSRVLNQNIVKIGVVQCNIVAGNDTTLYVLVSTGIEIRSNNISVEISGNVSEYTAKSFKLKMPTLTGFYPSRAYWNDTLIIHGKNFKTLRMSSSNSVKIGSATCTLVTASDTTVTVTVPNEVDSVNCSVIVKINGISLNNGNKFELRTPYFTFSPENSTWLNTITLTGRFNGLASCNSISFSNSKASITCGSSDIISTSQNTIKIRIPISLSQPGTIINYSAKPFTVSSADTFRLNPPVIKSFSPTIGAPNTLVTIKGKNFDTYSYRVLFGDTPAYVSGIIDSTIYTYVPSGLAEFSKITVVTRLQHTRIHWKRSVLSFPSCRIHW